ncbi:MAG: hypothetical protein ACRYGP_12510 [Janthinobacterium lividum]
MDSDSGTAPSRQTVTAFFETRAAADHARADLLAAGFASADVQVLEGQAAQDKAAPHKDVGFVQALLDIFVFMPTDDRATYAEGLRRGGIALAVQTGADGYERAIDILDRDGAVNLDERETAWKAEGWAPSSNRPASADTQAFEGQQQHDPLIGADANRDVRERIGVGTSDFGAGMDLAPESAVAPGPERTAIPGEESESVTARRDTEHGRMRVRSYIGSIGGMPTGVDPSI